MNLLQNGDFSGGTYPHVEWGWPMHSTQIPDGWVLVWHGREGHELPGEWALIESGVLRSGDKPHPYPVWDATGVSNSHLYIIQQRVIVPRGTRVRARARCWPWASNGDQWSDGSAEGSYFTAVGIDPLGREGVRWDTPGVVWSTPMPGLKAHSREIDHQVEATAQVDAVTVCLYGWAEWRLKNNRCVWYGASLEAVGEEPPEPPPSDFEARLRRVENIVNRLGHVSGFDRDFAVWLPWFLPKGEQAEQLARMAQIEDAGKGEEWRAVLDAARKAKSKTPSEAQ